MTSSERKESKSREILDALLTELGRTVTVSMLELSQMSKSVGCTGCFYCHENKECYKLGNRTICNSILESDVIILSSPIYYGNVNGLMKLFLDSGYAMNAAKLKGKKVYFIGASTQENQAALAISTLLPWVVKTDMIFLGALQISQNDHPVEKNKVEQFVKQILDQIEAHFETSMVFEHISVLGETYSMLAKYDTKKIR